MACENFNLQKQKKTSEAISVNITKIYVDVNQKIIIVNIFTHPPAFSDENEEVSK